MSLESLEGAGVVGIVALLIIKEVFNFVKAYAKKNEPLAASAAPSGGSTTDADCDEALNRLTKMDERMASLASSTKRMCTVLEKSDSSGLPLIYRDGSLTQAVAALGVSIEKLTDKVDRL